MNFKETQFNPNLPKHSLLHPSGSTAWDRLLPSEEPLGAWNSWGTHDVTLVNRKVGQGYYKLCI